MKTANTALDLWYSEPALQSVLKRNNIVSENKGRVVIPAFRVQVEREGKKEVRDNYPFYCNKFEALLSHSG